MLDLLQNENILWLIGIAVVFAVLFIWRFLSKKYSWNFMKALEEDISNWAKEQADNKTKREEAVSIIAEKVYILLPPWVQLFITKNTLKKQLNLLYGELLDYLDDGINNDSIV